jgi:hypothetical protein
MAKSEFGEFFKSRTQPQPTPEDTSESFTDFLQSKTSPKEEVTPPKEEKKSFWDTFGQGLVYQMKSGGPAGAPSLSPEQAKKVAVDVGTQAAVSGAFAPLKYLASLSPYAPRALQFITGLTQAGATGAAIPAAEALVQGEELPSPEELLKEGALWAGIDLVLQTLHLGTSFAGSVNKLAKEAGISRRETVSRIWKGAKSYYGWGEPKVDPETGVKIIPPEQIEAMTKFAEREIETLSGEAERIQEAPLEPAIPAKKDILTDLFQEKAKGVTSVPSKKISGEYFEINPKFYEMGYLPGEQKTHLKWREDGQNFLSESTKKSYKSIPKNALNQLKKEWTFFLPPQYFDKFYTSLPAKSPIWSSSSTTTEDYSKWYEPVFLGTVNDLIKDENIRNFLRPILYRKVYKMSRAEEHYRWNRAAFYDSARKEIHLSSGYSPYSVYSSLMHEAFHALQDEHNVLNQPHRRYIPRPKERYDHKKYLESDIEREARSFQRIVEAKIDRYRRSLKKSQSVMQEKERKIRLARLDAEHEASAKDAASREEQKKISPERISVTGKKTELSPKQIQDRKIAEAEQKKIKEHNAAELKERKSQAEKERVVAFKAIGIGQAKEAAPEVKSEIIPDNQDGTELEETLEETLSPNDTLRAQAMAEAQHMRDKIVGKLSGVWAKFDVEAPFKSVDAPKTGKAVKLFYDTKNAYLEEAKGIVKDLKGLKLSKDQLWDSFLAAESGSQLPTPEMNKARDIFRDYFDQSYDKLKKEGVLTLPWPQSAIARLEQTISDLKTKLTMPNIKKQAQGKIGREIQEIRKTIALLKELKYIPKSASLITQALAEVLPDLQPKTLRKFAIAAHKKRTSGALADWIATQPQIREVLHPYDFLGNYANRKGSDIALLRIANGAIDEGLASKGERLGFKMQPGEFPALEGYYLHPALYEYLKNLTNPVPFNAYDKISRWAKASIVFDPTYLGTLLPYFRTLIQNPTKLAKLPKYWKKSLYDMLNKTPAYVEFIENGGASNPYPEVQDFQTWLEVEKLKNGSPEQLLFQQFLTKEGAVDLFNKMANFSWMVDRLARMAYYNLMIDKGFSVPDAAKLAAENFVDYNKLPAKTRRWMGRLFFAPATQVLSIIQDVVMAASPFRLAAKFFKDKKSYKNDNINKERMRLLAGTIIVLGALSQLMKSWGFKEEEFGTRYVAEYEDENGRKKESVNNLAHPLNYSLRWVNTFWRGFGPGETSPSQKLWGRLTGQLGPVPNMIRELGDNQDRNGKKIWDPIGDSYSTAFWKINKYILSRIEPFGLQKFHTTDDKKEARTAVKNRMGWAEWFMDSIQFLYTRKSEPERIASRIRSLKSQMKKLAKTGELTPDAQKRYEEAIEELASSMSNKR